jgi:hypothetical protein
VIEAFLAEPIRGVEGEAAMRAAETSSVHDDLSLRAGQNMNEY